MPAGSYSSNHQYSKEQSSLALSFAMLKHNYAIASPMQLVDHVGTLLCCEVDVVVADKMSGGIDGCVMLSTSHSGSRSDVVYSSHVAFRPMSGRRHFAEDEDFSLPSIGRRPKASNQGCICRAWSCRLARPCEWRLPSLRMVVEAWWVSECLPVYTLPLVHPSTSAREGERRCKTTTSARMHSDGGPLAIAS